MPLPQHIAPQQGDRGDRAGEGRRRLLGRRAPAALVAGLPGFRPCTPCGLHEADREHRRRRCAASTRSSSAAATRSASRWRCCCLQADATVTICHSAHARPRRRTRGRPTSSSPRSAGATRSTADMVKPGAVVIDVGMNRNDAGKLCGDVDFAGVVAGRRRDHAGAGRRRADDDRDAARQHGRGRRARRPTLTSGETDDHESTARLHAPCRASARSARSTSRRRSTQLLAEADAALDAPSTGDDCRPTTTRCRPCSTSPTERLGARLGRRRPPERAWPTRPSCAPPTPQTLPKVIEFHTRLGADERLLREVQGGRWRSPKSAALTRAAPQGAGQRAARLHAVGRRARKATRRRASRRSRIAWPSSARSSPSTCSTRPTATPTTRPRPSSPACPPT